VKATVDNLDQAFMQILNEYKNACDENADEAVQYTAKEAVKELRNAHPAGSGQYGPWDKYNKGWKIMQTKTDKRYHRKATIHNATDYQLTHLLEKGHAKVNGGRTRAFPHIAPVAENCEDELVKNIRKWI
jgi:hypothetical protein